MTASSGRRALIDHASGHLLRFIVRYRGRLAVGVSCVVLTNAIALLGPWVLKHAVDDLAAGVTDARLAFYAGLMLAVAVAGGAARFTTRRAIVGASRAVEYDIRSAFFRRLQQQPLAYFHARRTGDLMSRATHDLGAVRMMVGPAVMYAASTGLTCVVALAMMLAINARLTALALLPLPFVTMMARIFGRMIHERFERIQAQLADMSAVTQEALAGVRVIRAYRQESHELARFRDANLEYIARNRALIRLQALFYPSMGLLMGVSELLVLWLGSRDVILDRMTVGDLVAFNSYLLMLAWPMIAFGWVTNLVQRGRASWERMLDVLDAVPSIDDAGVTHPALRAADVEGEVEIRGLSFSYGGDPVLRDVTLSVPAGRTLAIVGPTGSGKSTLVSLLPRLHDPPPGTVFVDGVDVREMPLDTLRRAIGFVSQEPFLFSDTVAENIAFGAPAASPAGEPPPEPGPGRWPSGLIEGFLRRGDVDARARAPMDTRADHDWIREVARTARLDEDVAALPQAYDTRIGERGITLSGGQKQRTALARALYVRPRILVLDDALSSVDAQTEEEILARLRDARGSRTTIIVSHRVSSVRGADLIAVLAGGRIVERGTHDELLAHGGLYAALARQQSLETEVDAW